MPEIVKMSVESITPLMRNVIVEAAARSAGDNVALQTTLVGFATIVWPGILAAGGAAAEMALADSQRLHPIDGPFRAGEVYPSDAKKDNVPYRIDAPQHSGKIEVYGDEALRDRIIELLNTYGAE